VPLFSTTKRPDLRPLVRSANSPWSRAKISRLSKVSSQAAAISICYVGFFKPCVHDLRSSARSSTSGAYLSDPTVVEAKLQQEQPDGCAKRQTPAVSKRICSGREIVLSLQCSAPVGYPGSFTGNRTRFPRRIFPLSLNEPNKALTSEGYIAADREGETSWRSQCRSKVVQPL